MQKQRKQTAKMLAGLQNGDNVVTSGGIVGTIVSLDSDTVVLRVKPDNIKIQVARSACPHGIRSVFQRRQEVVLYIEQAVIFP
jgi:preprotein translocase YajC subunit